MKIPIDETKLLIIIKKSSEEFQKAKERMTELASLVNQASSICQSGKGEKPMSSLTKKELRDDLRLEVYQDIVESAIRLKIISSD